MPFNILIDILLYFFVSFYALTLMGLTWGLLRSRGGRFQGKPFVSVIVAARNEELHLVGLLDRLMRQDYPAFEVIIVNDRSTDGSIPILERFQKQNQNVRRIDIVGENSDMPSKKHALAQGIAASSGEILVFTDADCLPPPTWISSLITGFTPEVGLVAGYSPYSLRDDSNRERGSFLMKLLNRFVEYEEFKGAAWSAGSIGVHLGWLCTGRSLAYRRLVYDEVGGFQKIKHSVSGDDDLFLQLVRRTTKWRMSYVTTPKSHVPTYPPDSFREFVEQRTRHFSAGMHFTVPMKIFFFLFHLSNLVILVSLLVAITGGSSVVSFLPYLIKCLVDSLLFFVSASQFHELQFAPQFLFMEILVVLYNTFIGPLGFIKKFQWKPGVRP